MKKKLFIYAATDARAEQKKKQYSKERKWIEK